MREYTIIAHHLALPFGTRFTCRPQFPIEPGEDYLLTIDGLLTVGGYYRDVDGCDWIVQPRQIVPVNSDVDIEIWGVAVPLEDPIPDMARFPLLAASVAIIELCSLAMPIAT